MHAHAGLRQGRDEGRRQVGRAKAVNGHVDPHAARGGLEQRRLQRQADLVLEQDEGFKHHLAPGGGDAVKNARKKRLAVFQQVKRVAADPARHAVTARAVPPPLRGNSRTGCAMARAGFKPDLRRQRRMVRKPGPWIAGQHDGGMAEGSAHITPVQLQHRQTGRKGAGRVAMGLHEDLVHIGAPRHLGMGAAPPVVEVAGHDHRRARGNFLAHHVAQHLHLLRAVRFHQPQVDANGVDIAALAGHLQLAMQHAAPLGAADGNVAVFKLDNRELGQQRIAVMPVGIDRVAAIGELLPDAVGQVFVMRRLGVVVELLAMLEVIARHLLQKHHIRAHDAHRVPQFGQDELAVEKSESLVDIDREHLEGNRRVACGGCGHGHGAGGFTKRCKGWLRGRVWNEGLHKKELTGLKSPGTDCWSV